MSVFGGSLGLRMDDVLKLSQLNFTAPLASVPLPRDFTLPEGSTLTFSTTATGKPVAHISGPQQDNPVQHWASDIKENPQVASNSKAYEVTLTNGDVRTIEANEAQQLNGRLTFLGAVEGHDDYSRAQDVVASFLSDSVAEYRVVPVPKEDKVGNNTYEVTFEAGGSDTVVADRVLHTKGSDKTPGQFTFVTNARNGETRTDFLVGEDKVHTIKRVTATGDVSVPAQADAADATASA